MTQINVTEEKEDQERLLDHLIKEICLHMNLHMNKLKWYIQME